MATVESRSDRRFTIRITIPFTVTCISRVREIMKGRESIEGRESRKLRSYLLYKAVVLLFMM